MYWGRVVRIQRVTVMIESVGDLKHPAVVRVSRSTVLKATDTLLEAAKGVAEQTTHAFEKAVEQHQRSHGELK